MSSAAAPCRPGHFGGGGGTDTAGTWWASLGPAWGRVRDEVRPLRPSAVVAQPLLITLYAWAIATPPPWRAPSSLFQSASSPPGTFHCRYTGFTCVVRWGEAREGRERAVICLAGGGCYGAEPRPPDPHRETAVAVIRRGAPPAACATGTSPRRATGLTKTGFAPVRARLPELHRGCGKTQQGLAPGRDPQMGGGGAADALRRGTTNTPRPPAGNGARAGGWPARTAARHAAWVIGLVRLGLPARVRASARLRLAPRRPAWHSCGGPCRA